MNDDELRDHLRSTLEPVSSPTPELIRLRRIARRRRQRRQFTAGALGLALIAGVGFGIAEATTAHSGRATLTAGPSPSTAPADVTAPCQTGHVALRVGQTLRVGPCPDMDGHTVGAVSSSGAALSRVSRDVFHADEVGVSTLQIEYTGCAGPPDTVCAAAQRLIGTISVNVGVPSGPAADVVATACRGGRVTVAVGTDLQLADCPVGLSSHIDDTSVLAPGATVSAFTARKAGTTNVELSVKPVCSPGTMCPQYVRDLGTLVVTVTSSTSTGLTPMTSGLPSTTRETPAANAPGDPSTWKVSIAGYGPLKIGMSQSQMQRILGSSYRPNTNTGSPTCAIATVATIPDVSLYLDRGTFITTSVGDPYPGQTGGPQSGSGIHVGMSEAAVKQALGPSVVAQQPTSTYGTEYVLTTSTGMASALVQHGVVVSYEEGKHAGFEDGCA